MKNINAKKIVAVMAALSLASMALMAGCAARTMTYTGLQTPGIMTQPVEDAVKLAAEKAVKERMAQALEAKQTAEAWAAEKAAEEAKAAADDAALDGGEIVEDENAPEGTVAVKTSDGETRYVPADKAEKSVQSGNTKPKAESNSGSNGGSSNKGSNAGSSNGGSSSSNGGSSNSGSNSGSSNSGSSNGGGSASKPAPAPEPEPAPAPEPEPDHKDEVMNGGATTHGYCMDCGHDGPSTGGSHCPACGSTNYGHYFV